MFRCGYVVLMHNAKYYGGQFEIATEIEIDDGYLDIVWLIEPSIYRLCKVIWHMIQGTLINCEYVQRYRTTEVQFIKTNPQHVHVDVEYMGEIVPSIHIEPAALSVIV